MSLHFIFLPNEVFRKVVENPLILADFDVLSILIFVATKDKIVSRILGFGQIFVWSLFLYRNFLLQL